jgi:hypothetical protein
VAPGYEGGEDERHALAALDPFTDKRYDVYWRPKEGTLWEAVPRREGCAWTEIDHSAGVALVLPMRAGSPFCAFGTASGYDARRTRVKEHTFSNTQGGNWISSCWDHWPVGWINSQGHVVDGSSLGRYPNHFSPAGMDMFAVANAEVERGEYWSLIGVGGKDMEAVRRVAREWLELGPQGCREAARVVRLPLAN